MRGGYTAIGMDHFSLESDPMSKAYFEKRLTRNFQGYSLQLADDMIGMGITSIGFVESAFFQNLKDLADYQNCLGRGELPVHRGFILSDDDIRRRWIIQSLMCHFELDKREYEKRFGHPFDFPLDALKGEGFVEETAEKLLPTPVGRLFIRIIASAFLMGGALLGASHLLAGNYAEGAGFLAALWGLALLVAGGISSYFILAHVTGAMRLGELKSMLQRS